jgi:hypothetical protein
VRYLRLKSVRDEFLQKEGSSSEFASKRNADMEQEKKDLGTQLKRGKYTLFATAIALGVGMGLISFGLSKTIFSSKIMNGPSGGTNAVPAAASNGPLR